MKESDMFDALKTFFENNGDQVYAEVELPHSRGRADMIAYNKPACIAIEMKTSLNLKVIEQAISWIPHVHYIYIAVPKRKTYISNFVQKLLSQYKLGLIEVNLSYSTPIAQVSVPARFNRPVFHHDFGKLLLPEHQTWTKGGISGGGYVTAYKIMMSKVKQFLCRNQGLGWISINTILDHCETYYASPKSSLSNALVSFERDWCECEVIKGKRYYRYKKGAV